MASGQQRPTGRPALNRSRHTTAPPAIVATATSFVVTLSLYLITMNRTIGFIDRGELAATAWTLGIPHPTGYPTLTLLGWLVTHLVPLRPVLVLNAFAAVLVAAGVGALTLLVDDVLARVAQQVEPPPRAVLAALGATITGVSATWWEQANGYEAYALQALLLPLTVLLFLRWTDEASGSAASGAHSVGPWFAVTLGLAFTAHLTTVLLAPALLFFAWNRLGGLRLLRAALPLAPAFLVGLLPYALLPLRSAQGPRFDWGGTHTLYGFLDHVSGREFRGWMFADPETWLRQACFLAYRLPWDAAWAGLLAVALGAGLLARRSRPLGAALALVIVSAALYACGYRIRELDPYLLGCIFGLGIFVSVGLLAIRERFGLAAAVTCGLLLITLNVSVHWRDCDERSNRLVEDLTLNQLQSLPPQTLLFTRQWDYFLASSFYFQEVEGTRRDVVVVSADLLRFGWYVDELQRRAPGLVSGVSEEARCYRAALRPFERHDRFDPATIAAAYRAFVDSLAACALRDRPVFCTPEAQDVLHGPWTMVPVGLALQIRADSAYVADISPSYRFESWPGHMDGFVATIHWIYASAFVARAAYERAHGREDLARRYLDLATRLDPHIQLGRIPPLPLDGNALVAQATNFFNGLERSGGGRPAAQNPRPPERGTR
jgi:hypothetical protein